MSGFACGASPTVVAAALVMVCAIAAIAAPGFWRRGTRRRGRRFAALAAALLGLLGLVVRPRSEMVDAGERAVLVTPGGAAGAGRAGQPADDGAAQPLRFLRPRRALERGAVASAGREGWETLPDARTLWRREPSLRRLEVRGYGLDAADFGGFEGAIEAFAPPALPAGVMAAVWPRRVALGASWAVQLRAAPATAGRIDLAGPDGVEAGADAAEVRQGTTLTVRPKAAGHFLYRLEVHDAAGRTIAGEPLDVTVEAPKPPRTMVLFAAPSFESRALLPFLAAAGVPFVASLELTRGRSHLDSSWPSSLGSPPVATAPLGAASLARCDLLLLDGRSWKALPAAERAAVGAAVDDGLGVVLFDADAAQGEESGFPLLSRPLAAARAAGGEARLAWPGQEPLAPIPLPAREIASAAGEEPLVSAPGDRVVAARLRRGRGAVALSLVEESFPWTLDADSRSYADYWARLLGAVARPDTAPRFLVPGGPLVADRALDVTLVAARSADGAAPRVELHEGAGASPLPLFASGPGRFAARLWPRGAGWLRLTSSDGAEAWLYAGDGRTWRTWQKAERVAATAARAAEPPAGGRHAGAPAPRPWPRLPLYLLFLCGVAWLWFDERVRTGGPLQSPPAR